MKEIALLDLIVQIWRKLGKKLKPIAISEGLSIPEGLILWSVHSKGASRVTEVASAFGQAPSTVTGILDRLVAGGWLLREEDPKDRRVVVVRGTPKLDVFFKTSQKAVAKILRETLKDLPPDMVARLCADLARVLACFVSEEETR